MTLNLLKLSVIERVITVHTLNNKVYIHLNTYLDLIYI